MDVDHKSHTAYGADNYNDEIKEVGEREGHAVDSRLAAQNE
jgi:hypothetical protein